MEDDLQLLKQTLDGKEELEKQHRENIRKLNSVVERQEKDVVGLEARSVLCKASRELRRL